MPDYNATFGADFEAADDMEARAVVERIVSAAANGAGADGEVYAEFLEESPEDDELEGRTVFEY